MLTDIIDFRNARENVYRYSFNIFMNDIIGTSDCNTHIPLYSLFIHTLYNFQDRKIIEYTLPNTDIGVNSGRYPNLFQVLNANGMFLKFTYKVENVYKVIYCTKGLIYDENNKILMCLCLESSLIENFNLQEIFQITDTSKFVLMLSTSFLTDPIYKNVRKKILEKYETICREEKIDILHTHSIEDKLFKNNVQNRKFKSVIEMKKYLKEEVPKGIIEQL
jgi:hypothetical protein